MIIGTAGHIDHGKTTLVRALTGVDTDRLPEEKRRGISIELGYAYPKTADGRALGYVDVPGHERLLHTMLAGATGIDHALLLVAADDGVMPQTREHLAVISLLGIAAGTIAITKVDRAEADRVAAVRAEIAALVAGTPLAGAPVFEVSAVTGAGIDALRAHLETQARGTRAADPALGFRLAIDRAFTLTGAGTVVTGAVQAGRAAAGDELTLMPTGRTVRVRSLRVHDAEAAEALSGERAALALAGLAKDDVHRGDVVCAPEIALATARLDVVLTLWHEESQPLKSGATVHVHLGTATVLGSVALLDRDALSPGDTGLAQLVLRQPVCAWHGDRGVLRDGTASRTLAGLRVLDPFAPTRYRRTPERLAVLRGWDAPTRETQLAALVAASPLGLDLAATARALGIVAAGPAALPAERLPLPADALRLDDRSAPQALSATAWAALREAIVGALETLHGAEPEAVGPDTRRLRRLAAPRVADVVWRARIATLLADGTLAQSGAWLHLPAHAVRLSAAEEKLAQQLLPPLLDGGYDPPWVRDLAKQIQSPEAIVRLTLARLAQRGQVYPVVRDLYYPAATVERLAVLLRDCSAAAGPAGVPAAAFRDATGLGRKRAIQILEFFDRIGYTRRVKDQHVLRTDTALFGTPPG